MHGTGLRSGSVSGSSCRQLHRHLGDPTRQSRNTRTPSPSGCQAGPCGRACRHRCGQSEQVGGPTVGQIVGRRCGLPRDAVLLTRLYAASTGAVSAATAPRRQARARDDRTRRAAGTPAPRRSMSMACRFPAGSDGFFCPPVRGLSSDPLGRRRNPAREAHGAAKSRAHRKTLAASVLLALVRLLGGCSRVVQSMSAVEVGTVEVDGVGGGHQGGGVGVR